MDADNVNSNQPCQCELCQPNWYLGSGGDFIPQPAEQVMLDEVHMRKLHAQFQQEDFVPVSG